jgi:signal transduction histidine kinase
MEPTDKRLVLAILQELTVAALDLFDPHHSMRIFLERVAERMGCLAVLVIDVTGPAPRLLDAAGLSAASRALPLGPALPFPELARPGLVQWRFPLGDPPQSTLILCFHREPADQYRGMMRRLASIFETALGHRLLYARSLDSEAAARRATEAREELVAVVSHDLKNPLATIRMTTGQLLEELGLAAGSEGRRGLERIQRSADRMTRLIRDLLDLAKLDGGHLWIDLAPQGLDDLVTDVVEGLRAEAAAKSLHLDLSGGHQRARCDRDRILQVLTNLLSNAIKFTPVGGTVRVDAKRRDHEVVVSVGDTGPGIPPDERAHIFDRFWQAQQTARLGTGLGLSIAKGLVERHGGHLWVDSEVGAGSTFSFTLPAA